MSFVVLSDPEFRNFNVSWSQDPTLQVSNGPRESDLYVLAQKARAGVRDAVADYEDTMHWTLRPAAFDSFQRTHGARAIEYRDWFYSKLYQFFEVLLHDRIQVLGTGPLGDFGPPQTERPWEEGEILRGTGPSIHPDDVEAAFAAGAQYPWEKFVRLAVTAGANRLAEVREVIRVLARSRTEPVEEEREARQWTDNSKRDRIILSGLAAHETRQHICQTLDQHLVPTTPGMRNRGCATWSAAWDDKNFRRSVQSVFSQVQRRNSVKK